MFGWIYDVNPGIGPVRVTAVTEPIYDVLRRHFLAFQQPHYAGNVLIGFLFGAVVALNFFRPRFWCRYVCPLGALLGVVGKNPLVRLNKHAEACNNCRLCLARVPGGRRRTSGMEAGGVLLLFQLPVGLPHTGDLGRVSETRMPENGGDEMIAPIFRWIKGFQSRRERPTRSRPPGAAGVWRGGHRRSLSVSYTSVGPHEVVQRGPGAAAGSARGRGIPRHVHTLRGVHEGLPHQRDPSGELRGRTEGMWTPVMNMKIGYCEYECTLCTQVCPTAPSGCYGFGKAADQDRSRVLRPQSLPALRLRPYLYRLPGALPDAEEGDLV